MLWEDQSLWEGHAGWNRISCFLDVFEKPNPLSYVWGEIWELWHCEPVGMRRNFCVKFRSRHIIRTHLVHRMFFVWDIQAPQLTSSLRLALLITTFKPWTSQTRQTFHRQAFYREKHLHVCCAPKRSEMRTKHWRREKGPPQLTNTGGQAAKARQL